MLGITFTVAPAGVEERRLPGESPRRYVERLSREKARAAMPAHPGALTVAGDTIVVLQGRVLEDAATLNRALLDLRGRSRAQIVVVRARRSYTIPVSLD